MSPAAPQEMLQSRRDETALREQIDRIAEILERLSEVAPDFSNNPELHRIVDDMVALGAAVAEANAEIRDTELLDNLAGMLSLANEWKEQAQGSLVTTPILVVSGAMAAIEMAIQAANAAAPGVGYRQPVTMGEDAWIEATANRDQLAAIARDMEEVKQTLDMLDAEASSPAAFRYQPDLLQSYVRSMRVPVALADLHLLLGRVRANIGALRRSVATMARLTEEFVVNVRSWRDRLTQAVVEGASRMRRAVGVVSGSVARTARSTMGRAQAAPAGSFPTTRDGPHLPALVRIPAGSFKMGAPAAENRREKVPSEYAERSTPQREMTIAQPFWIGKYPVTRGQFADFVEATGHAIPKGAWTYEPNEEGEWKGVFRDDRDWRNPGFEQTDDHPVVCVGYDDAMAYVDWLRAITRKPYRLPSEAEWEYAARAGTITARFWGDARDPACRYANVADAALISRTGARFNPDRFFRGDDGYAFTAPVGCFLPNPFGLYDMLGNVWEWCADAWTDKLAVLPSDGSANTTGDRGSPPVRGGSWVVNPGAVRAADRVGLDSGDRNASTGFRVARTL